MCAQESEASHTSPMRNGITLAPLIALMCAADHGIEITRGVPVDPLVATANAACDEIRRTINGGGGAGVSDSSARISRNVLLVSVSVTPAARSSCARAAGGSPSAMGNSVAPTAAAAKMSATNSRDSDASQAITA